MTTGAIQPPRHHDSSRRRVPGGSREPRRRRRQLPGLQPREGPTTSEVDAAASTLAAADSTRGMDTNPLAMGIMGVAAAAVGALLV